MASARPDRFPELTRGRVAVAVFLTVVGTAVAYRLRLGFLLKTAGGVEQPVLSSLRQLGSDALLGLVLGCVAWLCAELFHRNSVAPSPSRRPLRLAGLGLGLTALFGLGLLTEADLEVFSSMGTGWSLDLVREAMATMSLSELFSLCSPTALLFVPLPAAIFVALTARRISARRPVQLAAGASLLVAVGLGLAAPIGPLPEGLLHHPLGHLALELSREARVQFLRRSPGGTARAASRPDRGGEPADPGAPGLADAEPPAEGDDDAVLAGDAAARLSSGAALSLDGPEFTYPATERPVKKTLPPTAGRPYNIVLVVMESTGLDYALKPVAGGRQAMPFLSSIAEQGLSLTNHFSAGNSSPRGIFSLLSGLYVMPEPAIFDVRKDVYLPSLLSYLGDRYRGFLVTPGSLDWYFPHGFLLHSGFSELWGYHALPVRKNAPGGRAHARDEAESVAFFLRRLDELAQKRPAPEKTPPFVAVYYSFVAHWPYPDYGPATHVLPPRTPMYSYLNNLHYLDMQIEQIFNHLKQKNLLDDTIIVLAGDHGEAFGQHPHNYTHSRASYNENVRTPAVLYHPTLFPKRVITEPTSHVDVLPTLLDAVGATYSPALLQGESLFQDRFRRKYVFFYGNEDTVSSVSTNLIKLQISQKDGSCWAFDLKVDGEEKKRLGCAAYKEQQSALLLYRRNQRTALRVYNTAMHKGKPPAGAPPLEPGPARGPQPRS